MAAVVKRQLPVATQVGWQSHTVHPLNARAGDLVRVQSLVGLAGVAHVGRAAAAGLVAAATGSSGNQKQ
jgi:hypothetical protein